MKILFVVNELDFFLRTHLNLANRINNFHDVALIADATKNNQKDIAFVKKMGITLYELNRNKGDNKFLNYLIFIFSLLKLIRRINPSHIFYITLELSFFGSLIAHLHNAKKSIFIITGLGPFFFKTELKYKIFHKLQQYSFLFLSLVKKNFLFIFLNKDDQDLIANIYKINLSYTQIIHGEGIDESEFKIIDRDTSVVKFLLASRLVKSKGIESYIKVAKKIKQKYSNVKISIAGIFDPDNTESIENGLFKELSTSYEIQFLGEVPHYEMEKCFHDNTIFVLPSQREGLPKAAAEAASTGMPLILSDVPGCRDCIEDNSSGILVTYNNNKDLYEAMERFVNNPNLITAMGKKSSILAKEKFSLTTITEKYLKIIS